jgi:hypothetical protein
MDWVGGHVVRCCPVIGQSNYMMSALANHVQQMTTVQAADEGAACATLAQGMCQREATHYVTSADLDRCIGTERNLHFKSVVSGLFDSQLAASE